MSATQPIARSGGITPTERYLKQLCDRSFLSLWSYSGVYRDQGRIDGKGDGKEVVDLIVVFENHILLFSDKHCEFRDSGNLDVDWSRWYKRAIQKSADQVWGAERWIKDYPDRLFLDRECTQPFPIDLPDIASATFHRIVVAHGAAERCRKKFGGGSGSLLIRPDIIGPAHLLPREQGGMPFAVGQIDPARGFVHVLDETSLDIVMSELDTITDFVGYLTRKEQLILSGHLGGATGEEDLLAFYQEHGNSAGEHDFIVPPGATHIFIDESHWAGFKHSPHRRSRIGADAISYAWDSLIERFSGHMLAGTQYFACPHPGPRDGEKLLRFLAREPRTRRRALAESVIELVEKTPKDRINATRIIVPTRPGDPYYLFLLFARRPGVSDEEYREVRRELLTAYCMVLKLKQPAAEDIIGIATETGVSKESSEDAIHLDGREFTEENRAEAQRLQDEFGLLKEMDRPFARLVQEYPRHYAGFTASPNPSAVPTQMKGRDRNAPCPCGSGRKFKRCCGQV